MEHNVLGRAGISCMRIETQKPENSADQRCKVILFTPGETEAAPYTGWLTNRTLLGLYAQEFGGAMIMLERMWLGRRAGRV